VKKHLICLQVLVCTALAVSSAFAQSAQRGIARVRQAVPGEYIVLLAGSDDPRAVGLETATLYGGRLDHVYEHAVHGFAIRLPAVAAARLANDPRVLLVEENGVVRASDVQSSPPWGLDRIDQHYLPLDTQYSYSLGTTPVYVHVIDTGIRITHVQFGGRAFIGGDYITPSTGGLDCHGHGTHVAGTIGGATYGVAKNVTVFAQRVLDCAGNGTDATVIAALDAVTADTTHRPAVANMSLGGPPSSALDNAVRGTISSGVTVVVAAGNSNVDASTQSPARVSEAITVGATSSNDARASFSNFGSVLDLFAPGVSVLSAWYSSDTATATLSGTSMASPHVAGAAALYLESNPAKTPAQVASALTAAATPGVVSNPGTGSPNLLLFSTLTGGTLPAVTVTQPNGGEKLFAATPYTITWTASDPDGLASFDVLVSTNGGTSYSPVAGCSGLPASAQQCVWSAPGPTTSTARIKVSARDLAGDVGDDISNANFSIVSGTASITVTTPNTALNWGRGSMQQIKWSHNLGVASYVRIELSRDGGTTFPDVLAANFKNTASTSSVFNWRVTGPNSTAALVRITWTAGPTSDVGNTPFTIADPFITVTSPVASTTNWGYGTTQRTQWNTNLGPLDNVTVQLSTDGGATFPTTLMASKVASTKVADVLVPTLGAPTTTARVKVLWSNPPSGSSASSVSPANFRVEPAFVTVTLPNGGEIWTIGTATTVKWTSNLGALARVDIHLSTDNGATYPNLVVGNTSNDSAQSVTVLSSWATSLARIRVRWTTNPAVNDSSNAPFTIH
jgi:subtilisin family serine protease